MDTTGYHYTVARVWDAGAEWDDAPVGAYATEAEAVQAACAHIREYAKDGEYGQGDGATSVTIHYAIADQDGDEIDTRTCVADLDVDEDDLVDAAGGDADCDHDWSSEGEGGLTENPGVWSVGGTTIVTREHCEHCELVRETTLHGSQRNPGEPDTVRYYYED